MEELKNVKVGDWVTCMKQGKPFCVRRVQRVTETQIVTGKSLESRWRKKDGYPVGCDSWCQTKIVPATQDHRDDIKKHNLICSIAELSTSGKLSKFSIEQLEQIYGLLAAAEK